MTALNTAERGIPEEVYAGWRETESPHAEFGHKAEENFMSAMEKEGEVEILKEMPDAQKTKELFKEERIGVMRLSPKDDFEKGFDLYLFGPLTGQPVPVDMSVSTDPAVHTKKREAERQGGPRFLPLKARVLELAAHGSERDRKAILLSVKELLRDDALDQFQRKGVRIPETRRVLIEEWIYGSPERKAA